MDGLLDTAPCGFLVFEDDGTISLINQTLSAWLGYEPGELAGRSLNTILSVGGRIFHQTHILPLLQMSGKAEEIYFSLKAKDGQAVAMLTNAARREKSGRFSNHCIFLPMRQRREYEDELLQAKKVADEASQAKAKFLSLMSHELRTPMNAILGFGQLLQMDELDEMQAESVDHIVKSGQHLLELINEVLDISRIEAGHLEVSIESVSSHEIMSEALGMARPLAAKAGIEAKMLPGVLGERSVFADRSRLRQVLLNLLANGIKYNRPGGTVTIAAEAARKKNTDTEIDRALRFSVCDTGAGIAPDKLLKLFLPFERLGAEKSDVEGTGLGLALSKRLTEAMGGNLGVRSIMGEGSCFWIELPIADEEIASDGASTPACAGDELFSTQAPENEKTKAASPTVKVLYIDDSDSNVYLMQRIFTRRPEVHFLSAANGAAGLEMAQSELPALILLDLELPDMNGDAVLQQLLADERTAVIPVVMLSADAAPHQAKRLLELGAREYLTKPFEVEHLMKVVQELLEESARVNAKGA